MVMIPIKQPTEIPSPGWHRATILSVEDIGEQKSRYSNSRLMVDMVYRIEDQNDSRGNPLTIAQGETKSIMVGRGTVRPSKLYKILTEGLGITVDQSGAFDSDAMVNRELWINIQHKRMKQGEYANVVGWSQRKPIIVEEVKEVAGELAQELEGQ